MYFKCKKLVSHKIKFFEKLDIRGTHRQINFEENVELKKNRNCQKNRINDETDDTGPF